MNILGTCRHLLQYLSLNPAQSSEPQAEKGVDDSDGPGAGGGYDDSVEIDEPSDGPGAGGGYDSFEVENPSDGPGAGGGYDGLGDNDGPGAGGGYHGLSDGPGAGGGYETFGDNDNDGPGAGGGYDSDEHFVESSANYLGEEWFLGSGAKNAPANSNKSPAKGKAK